MDTYFYIWFSWYFFCSCRWSNFTEKVEPSLKKTPFSSTGMNLIIRYIFITAHITKSWKAMMTFMISQSSFFVPFFKIRLLQSSSVVWNPTLKTEISLGIVFYHAYLHKIKKQSKWKKLFDAWKLSPKCFIIIVSYRGNEKSLVMYMNLLG